MSAPWFIVAVVTLLGLALGSFVNVVVYRLPRKESLAFPGSHCPSCSTPIKRRHNVPVLGWLVLRGRCAACAEPISARYPLVEAAMGVLFGAITVVTGLDPLLPAYLLAAGVAFTSILLASSTRTAL